MHPPRIRLTPTVDSPCIRNCCLNERDVCLGCGRTLNEILQWQSFSDDQRSVVLQDAQLRRDANKNKSAI